MYKLLLIVVACSVASFASAQNKVPPTTPHQYVDLALTAGASQGTAAFSYVYHWKLGKKQAWQIGLGARLTGYAGTKKDYTTAPARLSRTSTVPFLIFFAGQETKNWDTLNVQRPFTQSLNATINIGYQFNTKWSAGFNIDLIGFTLGRTTSGVLTSNGTTRTDAAVKPAAFNLLLTGDHDLGSLNSELFLAYHFSPKWSLRGVYQFYFSEYKTTNIKQTAPDGTQVDRFRNKVNAFGLGISRHF